MGCKISWEKSVTNKVYGSMLLRDSRGCVCFNFPGKKNYVTLELLLQLQLGRARPRTGGLLHLNGPYNHRHQIEGTNAATAFTKF